MGSYDYFSYKASSFTSSFKRIEKRHKEKPSCDLGCGWRSHFKNSLVSSFWHFCHPGDAQYACHGPYKGPTALAVGDGVHKDQLSIAEKIFEASGKVVVVEEKLMDAVTGLKRQWPCLCLCDD